MVDQIKSDKINMSTAAPDYNSLSINELLERRHEIKLSWREPWTGCGPEGNEVTVHVELRATIHDCINWQRAAYKHNKEKRDGVMLTKDELVGKDGDFLLDFMAVNWASFVRD